jgi:hypothetical protein
MIASFGISMAGTGSELGARIKRQNVADDMMGVKESTIQRRSDQPGR